MDNEQLSPQDHVKALKSARRLLIYGCYVLPVLYWIGVIDTGPVEWLQSTNVLQVPAKETDSHGVLWIFDSMNRLTLWLAGGVSWGMVSAVCLMPFTRRITVKLLGSEAALEAAQEAIYLAETTPIPLGDLVTVTVNLGGFLSHDESSVETTQGFYRVYGRVGDVRKGATVTALNGMLRIGSDDDSLKQYTMLK